MLINALSSSSRIALPRDPARGLNCWLRSRWSILFLSRPDSSLCSSISLFFLTRLSWRRCSYSSERFTNSIADGGGLVLLGCSRIRSSSLWLLYNEFDSSSSRFGFCARRSNSSVGEVLPLWRASFTVPGESLGLKLSWAFSSSWKRLRRSSASAIRRSASLPRRSTTDCPPPVLRPAFDCASSSGSGSGSGSGSCSDFPDASCSCSASIDRSDTSGVLSASHSTVSTHSSSWGPFTSTPAAAGASSSDMRASERASERGRLKTF